MTTLTLYSFERDEGDPFGEFRTFDYREACEYAMAHGLRVIADEYEWAGSELVDDYTPDKEEV